MLAAPDSRGLPAGPWQAQSRLSPMAVFSRYVAIACKACGAEVPRPPAPRADERPRAALRLRRRMRSMMGPGRRALCASSAAVRIKCPLILTISIRRPQPLSAVGRRLPYWEACARRFRRWLDTAQGIWYSGKDRCAPAASAAKPVERGFLRDLLPGR